MLRAVKGFRGFTVVEIVLLVLIVGLLAAIVVPGGTFTQKETGAEACEANAALMNAVIEYGIKVKDLDKPASMSELDSPPWKELFPEKVEKTCPLGDRYKIDPRTGRVGSHDHENI